MSKMKKIREYHQTWEEFEYKGSIFRRCNGYWEEDVGHDTFIECYNPELEKEYKKIKERLSR